MLVVVVAVVVVAVVAMRVRGRVVVVVVVVTGWKIWKIKSSRCFYRCRFAVSYEYLFTSMLSTYCFAVEFRISYFGLIVSCRCMTKTRDCCQHGCTDQSILPRHVWIPMHAKPCGHVSFGHICLPVQQPDRLSPISSLEQALEGTFCRGTRGHATCRARGHATNPGRVCRQEPTG